MGRDTKTDREGKLRRRGLIQIAYHLGYFQRPFPRSSKLFDYILARKPECEYSGNSKKEHYETLILWFQRHEAIALNIKLKGEKARAKNAQQGRSKPHDRFKEFYSSWEWRKVRLVTLKEHGSKCQCCGATPEHVDIGGNPVRIVVDHIKPVRHHWNIRLDPKNLQVLCDECNMGKGSWDETDFRSSKT